jgi:hypothetical protein
VTGRECGAYRPALGDNPCEESTKFDVVYRSTESGLVLLSVPACFVHGLAEVDRATAAGVMADVRIDDHVEETS